MLETQQKYAGTRYTPTVALLVVAFVFTPAILMLSRPFGYIAPSLAVVCSASCVVFAWINWNWHSELTIPSMTSPRSK